MLSLDLVYWAYLFVALACVAVGIAGRASRHRFLVPLGIVWALSATMPLLPNELRLAVTPFAVPVMIAALVWLVRTLRSRRDVGGRN